MVNYETKIENLSNGNSFEYVNVNGTYFTYGRNIDNKGWKYEENEKLWTVISSLVQSRKRVRIWYGDTATGRSWNEEYDVTGRVSKSSGNIKVPILLRNSCSYYGAPVLDDAIIRVDDIENKRTLYCHPLFHVEKMELTLDASSEFPYCVYQYKDSGEVINIANFKKEDSARHYIAFMNGDRYCK